MKSTADKRAAFRALHAEGCFVIPNPFDAGSARMLQHMGFAALASSSAGYAWTTGHPDYAVTRDGVLEHLTSLCAAVDLPVNADFEAGFAREPADVAANVRLAMATGIAGLSIEDRGGPGPLFDTAFAVERIAAARAAIDRSGEDVILVARTETLLVDPAAISAAIDKAVALAEAGADCIFTPGIKAPDDIAALVRAVAPLPVNVLVLDPSLTVAQLADLGVRRISVGGGLARAAWGGFIAAAEAIKAGAFAQLAQGAPGKQLNDIFREFL